MRFLSVCSGIEAASCAWEPLGWKAHAFAEIEAFPSAVLKHHHPETPNWGDMTKFAEWPDATIDLLVGGTPCQSFSVAGLRKGLADPRGNLALTFLAIAAKYSPRYIVWENVPGVLSSGQGRDFGAFLGGLAQCGYGWAYRVLDAQYFGIPQRRRRVFVVGHLGDWQRAAAVLFERHSLSGDTPPRRETRESVAALTANGVGTCGADDNQGQAGHLIVPPIAGTLDKGVPGRGVGHNGNYTDHLIASTGDISHYLNAGGMGRQDYETETLIAHSLRGEGFDASEDGTGRGTPLVPVHCREVAGALTSNYGKQPDSSDTALGPNLVAFNLRGREDGAQPEADPDNLAAMRAASGGSSRSYIAFTAKDYGADASDIAPTLRSGSHDGSHANGGVMPAVAFGWQNSPSQGDSVSEHTVPTLDKSKTPAVFSSAVRRLTPRECERLQGFPDDYTLIPYRGKAAADGPRYKALGNSMAVPVMRWIGERIAMVEALQIERRAA